MRKALTTGLEQHTRIHTPTGRNLWFIFFVLALRIGEGLNVLDLLYQNNIWTNTCLSFWFRTWKHISVLFHQQFVINFQPGWTVGTESDDFVSSDLVEMKWALIDAYIHVSHCIPVFFLGQKHLNWLWNRLSVWEAEAIMRIFSLMNRWINK